MRIIFIRHGQTTGDIEDRYGGDYDDHLSPEGRKQSEGLSEELKGKGMELLMSSPLIRARETSEIISQDVIPIVIEKDLKEQNRYGILTGEVKGDAQQKYPDLVEKVKNRLNTIDGAESYEDFRYRIHMAFNRLTADARHSCIGIVWHGGPMRVLFRDILKKGELGSEIGDCSWVELQQEGNTYTVIDSRRVEFL